MPAPAEDEDVDVVVMGAGMAGLVAARELAVAASDTSMVVIDKGRGVGGRLATRRVGPATFDHGAPCFAADDEPLAALVGTWAADGVVAPWRQTPVDRSGHRAWHGMPSMTAVARHLATDRAVRTSWLVDRLRVDGDRWAVESAEAMIRARLVVLTCPVPQALALLDAGAVPLTHDDRAALSTVTYDPCIAVMATLDEADATDRVEWCEPDGPVVVRVIDQYASGTSAVAAMVIHASPGYSVQHWAAPDDEVVDDLVAAAGRLTGRSRPVTEVQVHRWRYARAVGRHPEPVLHLDGVPPILVCGDGFGSGDVNGAAASGLAAARAAADLMRSRP